MKLKERSGQVLILVLLVVVVALAVGLSVASRNITNLRTSTQTEQSQRAFTAAEGGVEDVLQRLATIANTTEVKTGGTYSETFPVGGLQATVSIKSQTAYSRTIELGEVGQINLDGATNTTNIQIEWAKNGDSSETAQPASIMLTLVRDAGGGNYAQTRYGVTGGTFAGRDESGFDAPGSAPMTSCTSSEYAKCTQIPWEAGAKLLRIRPLWVKATVKVSCIGASCIFPVQLYDISSVATTDLGVTRKVQVLRSALAELPAFFDYALYSEGDIIK
ncbi:hypothetical protein HYU92_01755 [Candidatus Curtissbacteria bacterium]|nr:hypothetical protein [Candidatus Curtissbacteria bacterium]